MQQTKRLPVHEIREMSLEQIAEELRVLDDTPKEVMESVKREALEILNTKEYCWALGINWVNLTNSRRADYAAMLIVLDGYSF